MLLKYFPSKHSSWWIRLPSSSSEDVLIKTNIFALVIRLQKTSWSRPVYSFWPYVFKLSSRRFQDVFKTSCKNIFKTPSRHLQDVLPRRLQDVFKTSSRHLQKRFQDIFKTFWKRLQGVFKTSSRRLQDIFKTSCKDAFKMFWRRIIRLNCLPSSRICLGHTSEKFMVSVENLQVWYILA